MGSRSAPASGEALPMEQEFKQGYRMHRILSNLSTDSTSTDWTPRIESESRPRETS